MIWLLGDTDDIDLLWLGVMLQRRGVQVEFLLPEELLIDSKITFRVDDLNVNSSLKLQDGRVFNDDHAGLLVNRLTTIPPIGSSASSVDAAYLTEEWHAGLAAWLRTLRCHVLNPPRASSLAGPVMLPAVWRRIANAFGLVSHHWESTHSSSATDVVRLFCLGTDCFARDVVVPPDVGRSLAKMGEFVGAPLLGATFIREGGQLVFVEATAQPPLAEGGEELIDAIITFENGRRIPT